MQLFGTRFLHRVIRELSFIQFRFALRSICVLLAALSKPPLLLLVLVLFALIVVLVQVKKSEEVLFSDFGEVKRAVVKSEELVIVLLKGVSIVKVFDGLADVLVSFEKRVMFRAVIVLLIILFILFELILIFEALFVFGERERLLERLGVGAGEVFLIDVVDLDWLDVDEKLSGFVEFLLL